MNNEFKNGFVIGLSKVRKKNKQRTIVNHEIYDVH